MKDPRWMEPGRKLFHVVYGPPDEDCEVCRAHGFAERRREDEDGFLLSEIKELEDLLACPCPLCRLASRSMGSRRRPKDEV